MDHFYVFVFICNPECLLCKSFMIFFKQNRLWEFLITITFILYSVQCPKFRGIFVFNHCFSIIMFKSAQNQQAHLVLQTMDNMFKGSRSLAESNSKKSKKRILIKSTFHGSKV